MALQQVITEAERSDFGTGSPGGFKTSNPTGDPAQQDGFNAAELAFWWTEEALADVRQMWSAIVSPEEQAWMRENIPTEVLERAIA